MDRQQEIQENILQQTRKEVLEYRTKLLAGYEEHIAFIKALPDKCENDYIKKTAEEVEKREAEKAKQAAAAKAAQQKAKPAPPKPSPKPAPAPAKPAPAPVPAKPAPAAAKPADKPKDAKPEGKTGESNLPFFKSPEETAHHDNLKFGKNNK